MNSNHHPAVGFAYNFYFWAFFALVLAVNPFQSFDNPFRQYNYYLVFVFPKLLILTLLIAFNGFVIVRFNLKLKSLFLSRFSLLLLFFLLSIFISYQRSENQVFSLIGAPFYGDGFLYWFALIVFVLTNIFVIFNVRRLFDAQLYGFLWGLVVLAVASVLSLEIFYSHRIYVSLLFLIAASLLKQRRLIWSAPVSTNNIVGALTKLLTAWMSKIFHYYPFSYYTCVGLAVLSFLTLDSFKFVYSTLTDRLEYWHFALKAMDKHLLFGYGFNGFDIAVNYFPAKAHNLFIDAFISWGFLGLVFYCAVLGMLIYAFVKYKSTMGIPLITVYLVYGFFAYDSAQYSHFIWWGLSSSFALISAFLMESSIYE